MSDYVLADRVRVKFDISEDETSHFEQFGILHPVIKNHLTYYSAADCYQLRAVLYFMREEGLSLDAARERIRRRPASSAYVPGTRGAQLAQK